MNARAAYEERRKNAEAAQKRLDGQAALLANGRGVTFIAALALAGFTLFNRLPTWGWWAALASLIAYVIMAVIHHRVLLNEDRAKVRAALNARGLARLEGRWHEFTERGERFLTPNHLYAADLDVFGQGSLFQLIDESATRAGEERLAAWLSEAAPPQEIRQRQEAIRELTPSLDFRQDLLVESRLASQARVDPMRFVAWAERGPWLQDIRWARPLAWILPSTTLVLFVLGRLEFISTAAWALPVAAMAGVLALTRKSIAAFYEQLSLGERGFVRFDRTFSVVEGQPFKAPLLQRVLGPLQAGDGQNVSARLRSFSRRFSFAEVRQSGQMAAILNLLLLWDIHWMFALEGWRREHGHQVRGWFEALAELEALSSLAGFAFDHPEFPFPEIADEGPVYTAQGLGHPLLDKPVPNDVSLPEPRSALIVTGSNMSGKTTMLRAMGANAVLALCGAPVCAQALRISRLHIATSMRVKDSLERGVSYFYAEVQRIRDVLEAARAANGNALFLLDEILLGTNTRERQIASRELLRLLLETGAMGAVTTHDLALTALADAPWAKVRNVHFRDQLVDGRMTFDYRMREGVVETTNALRVLAEAGVPISED
ncbi:MAG: DNA mismatch repair protein MutS [Myxococcaceae bacterium]